MKKQQYITPATETILLAGNQQLMALSMTDEDLSIDNAEGRTIESLFMGVE